MRRVMITGASGLVGGAIYEALKQQGEYDLVPISSQSHGDLSDNTGDLPENCDVIIHCAAAMPYHVGDDMAGQKTRLIDLNIAEYASINNSRVIYFSGCSIYDLTSSDEKKETDLLVAKSDYHQAKIEGEKLFLNNDDNIIIRIPSPYSEKLSTLTVLKKFCEQAKAGKDITIFGGGDREQNFIHTDDISIFILRVLEDWRGGVFNVASPHVTTMSELAEICCDLSGGDSHVVNEKDKQDVTEYARFSIQKAYDAFGWEPSVDLRVGLKKIIENS